MSSVASAIPTSNHKKNECGLSVLWHDVRVASNHHQR
jgi:hypothetical protein